jgi:hypothetical protein
VWNKTYLGLLQFVNIFKLNKLIFSKKHVNTLFLWPPNYFEMKNSGILNFWHFIEHNFRLQTTQKITLDSGSRRSSQKSQNYISIAHRRKVLNFANNFFLQILLNMLTVDLMYIWDTNSIFASLRSIALKFEFETLERGTNERLFLKIITTNQKFTREHLIDL